MREESYCRREDFLTFATPNFNTENREFRTALPQSSIFAILVKSAPGKLQQPDCQRLRLAFHSRGSVF